MAGFPERFVSGQHQQFAQNDGCLRMGVEAGLQADLRSLEDLAGPLLCRKQPVQSGGDRLDIVPVLMSLARTGKAEQGQRRCSGVGPEAALRDAVGVGAFELPATV